MAVAVPAVPAGAERLCLTDDMNAFSVLEVGKKGEENKQCVKSFPVSFYLSVSYC